MNECYKCKHKGTVAGSCHSSCEHPKIGDHKFIHALAIMKLGATFVGEKDNGGFIVMGEAHGVTSGWFNWPIDFDPVWLTRCDGCEQA